MPIKPAKTTYARNRHVRSDDVVQRLRVFRFNRPIRLTGLTQQLIGLCIQTGLSLRREFSCNRRDLPGIVLGPRVCRAEEELGPCLFAETSLVYRPVWRTRRRLYRRLG